MPTPVAGLSGATPVPPPTRATPLPGDALTTGRPISVRQAAGGSGGNATPSGQPTTPYGGVYPQPITTPDAEDGRADGLWATTAVAFRPGTNIRPVILTSGVTANGTTTWSYSGPISSAFSLRDAIVLTDTIQFLSNMRFGITRSAVTDSPSADMAQNVIMPQSAGSGATTRFTTPMGFTQMPFFGLDIYVNDYNSRLWMEFTNGDASPRNCMVIFIIELEPGSEVIP